MKIPFSAGVVIGREVRVAPRMSTSSSRAGHDSAPAQERCRAPAQIRPLLPSETRRQRTGRREKKQQKLREDGIPLLFLLSAIATSDRLKRQRASRTAGRRSDHGSAPFAFSPEPVPLLWSHVYYAVFVIGAQSARAATLG
ncbi:hypothetical protein MRX96_015690 [Rhipicephalus microplus]